MNNTLFKYLNCLTMQNNDLRAFNDKYFLYKIAIKIK